MTWVKLDDGFTEHPVVDGLTAEAFRLHVAGLCYCARNLTDGHIPKGIAPRLSRTASRRHINELVTSGLWMAGGGGYQIKNYLEFNPDRKSVESRRSLNAERQRKSRASRAATSTNADLSRCDNRVSHSTPSRPVPDTKDLSSSSDSRSAPPEEDERVDQALRIVAKRRFEQAGNVRSPKAWMAKVTEGLRAEESLDVDAVRFLAQYPDLTAAQLADVLQGNTTVLRHMRSAG